MNRRPKYYGILLQISRHHLQSLHCGSFRMDATAVRAGISRILLPECQAKREMTNQSGSLRRISFKLSVVMERAGTQVNDVCD
jgi:hypothetical protein